MTSMTNRPILVTGAARSGTSVTTGLIANCGIFGGRLAGPNKSNEKGMFENLEIRQNVTKGIMRKLGVDPMGQDVLPDINICHERAEEYGKWVRESVLNIMQAQDCGINRWFYKGAKMCLMWPIWHAAFPEAQWVYVKRDTKSHLMSLRKTPFMRARKDDAGWIEWIEEHDKRYEEMVACEGLDMMLMQATKMMTGDFDEAKSIIEWLRLDWISANADEFVDRKLWEKT